MKRLSTPSVFLLLAFSLGAAGLHAAGSDPPLRWDAPLPALRSAADNGDPRALALLGARLETGDGAPRDVAAALPLLERAAAAGDPIGMIHLAGIVEDGRLLPADSSRAAELRARAVPLLRERSDRGDPDASVVLGDCHAWGIALSEDQEEANRLYRRGAEAGRPRALYLLGYRLFHGIGAEPDRPAGVALLVKGAAAGSGAAAGMLGDLHATGDGAPLDPEKAEAYYRAAESGPRPVESSGPAGYRYAGAGVPGDRAALGHQPPPHRMEIAEGSCGEACLWSVLRARGIEATQYAINRAGGAPGRGLHAYELDDALGRFGIACDSSHPHRYSFGPAYARNWARDLLGRPGSGEDQWKGRLDEILAELRAGRPVLAGVKIYPDRYPDWPCDHFLLFVGLNEETGEILYNDFTARKRMPAESLLRTEEGYSLVNRYDTVFRVFFP